jgi:hypothetical protein
MKSKLGIFFVGFSAGVVASLLALGLAADSPAERHVAVPTIVYDNTNAAAHWQRVNRSHRH